MKRILVVSDTHNNTRKLSMILEKLNKDIDYLFHLGDLCTDIKSFIPKYPDIEFFSVSGNCDYSDYAGEEMLINIYNYKIFLSHGSQFDVKYNSDNIGYAAMEREADICLFGHTHFPVLYKQKNIVFMNPGSLVLPRGLREKTYGIINLYKDSLPEFSIVEVEKNYSRIMKSLK